MMNEVKRLIIRERWENGIRERGDKVYTNGKGESTRL